MSLANTLPRSRSSALLLGAGAAALAISAWYLRHTQFAETIGTLWRWAPVLGKGFLQNLWIGVLATAIGTMVGFVVGAGQVAPSRLVRLPASAVTQLFRNSPWLVCLFYVMYLVPFEMKFGHVLVTVPDWLKATIGLSLPAMGNMSEIVRGGLRSIPITQWEAGASLGYTRTQILISVIIPQAARRMLPPWMNLYCVITMSTSLANIVGVAELMTAARHLLVTENRPELLLPTYLTVLMLFFVYIYPLSRLTRALERRWAVSD